MKNYTDIQNCLIENLKNKNAYFIFSTDVVKNSWIDWIVMNPQISGTCTVSLDRFVAWDNFKSSFVSSSQEGKCVIPSLLRKFFVRDLIRQNSQSPVFKRIINPEFAQNASTFCDWLCKILPSLHLWYKKYNELILKDSEEAQIQKDDLENQDYLEIYNRYNSFLEQNNMFEPSWIQAEFISDKNYEFFVFYPEIYDDYADYVEIFSNTKNIHVVNLPAENTDGSDSPHCYKFSDARQELRRTILRLRKLVHPEEFGIAPDSVPKVRWDEIALSVPDLETYRPYIERELTKYAVPFVIRAGFPLTNNCAGQIFTQLNQCVQSDFSYDSIRSLLQNEYIPWKKTLNKNTTSFDLSVVKENLIREGNRMRCIFSYTEKDGQKVDIWSKALKAVSTDHMEYTFYRELCSDIKGICNAKSFDEIQKFWEIFKSHYLDEGEYSQSANDILGRCITHLKEMIEIEKKYSSINLLEIGNHYEFFLTELQGKTYTPQNKKIGLNVYPYKLTAQAKFKYQFIINSSQKNLEIPYKRLSFLTTEKRTALGLLEEDKKFNASHSFMRLYTLHCNNDEVSFSFCEDSFDGFAIGHTFLKVIENPCEELDKYDFYLNESKALLGEIDITSDSGRKISFTKNQKQQLEDYKNTALTKNAIYIEENKQKTTSETIKQLIKNVLITNRQKDGGSNYVFTQTDLKNFFPCPRKWLLSSVLNLQIDTLDTDLLTSFEMGDLNHKILENFMKHYCTNNMPLPVTNNLNKFDDENEVRSLVKECAIKVINSNNNKFSDSPLVLAMLNSQSEILTDKIMKFLHRFCIKKSEKEKISVKSKTEGFGGYLVKAVEQKKHLSGKKYDLYGKIDLVLSEPLTGTDVGWTIIDYKNSSIPAAKQIFVQDDSSLGDFQMPSYISLLTQIHPEDEKITDAMEKIDYAGFESINSDSSASAVDIGKQDHLPNVFGTTMKEFSIYLDDFVEALEKNSFEPVSYRGGNNHLNVDFTKHCPKCKFNSICRYNYTVGKQNIKVVNTYKTEVNSSEAE